MFRNNRKSIGHYVGSLGYRDLNKTAYCKPWPKNLQKKNRLIKWFIYFFLPLIVIIITYGIYLDRQIHNRVNSKIWQFPALIYSRIINLEPGMAYNCYDIAMLLKNMQYREVSVITYPGEFTLNTNCIELLRKSFNFPNHKESPLHVRITFSKNYIVEIKNKNTGHNLDCLQIGPKLIAILKFPQRKQQLSIPHVKFPNYLIHALIATEDKYLYSHNGIDCLSIARTFITNTVARYTVQNKSDLTQQLVKNLFFTKKRSIWHKLNEAYITLIINYRYNKNYILDLYLNEVYLGQNGRDTIHGFPLASLYYYGCPINELSLDQQATLVGMAKNASLYNPLIHPKLALERRNFILKCLEKQHIINKKLFNILSIRPLGVQLNNDALTARSAFIQKVRKELKDKLKNKNHNLSNVKIFTTLDPLSQNAANKAIKVGVHNLRTNYKLKDLEAAIMIVDRFNGEIRAMVSRADPPFSRFNQAMDTRRSIGSLAKITTYLTALKEPDKYRLNTWIADKPIIIKQPNGSLWSPKNYDQQFRGKVMLIDALIDSLNVPTINLGLSVGINRIISTMTEMGVPISVLNPLPTMLLGEINLTPMEVAQEFQTIANDGNLVILSSIRSVIDETGTIIYQSFPHRKRVIPAQTAYLIMYAMQQVVVRGASRILSIQFPFLHLAAKTGTTNGLHDSWFAGIDGKEVFITWVGRNNNGPTKLTGASGALMLYCRYLENQIPTALNLTPPKGISQISINCIGDIICDNVGITRKLPVWINHKMLICKSFQNHLQQQSDLASSKDQKQQTLLHNKEKNINFFKRWILKIFDI